jgi:hypothetical protein
MAEFQALCMKCRDDDNKPTMHEMQDVKIEEKNNRFSARGQCVVCSGNMFKFMSKDDAEKMLADGDATKMESADDSE